MFSRKYDWTVPTLLAGIVVVERNQRRKTFQDQKEKWQIRHNRVVRVFKGKGSKYKKLGETNFKTANIDGLCTVL